MVSYMTPTMDKYTAVMSLTTEVRGMLSMETGVITMSQDTLKIHNRGGAIKLAYRYASFQHFVHNSTLQ